MNDLKPEATLDAVIAPLRVKTSVKEQFEEQAKIWGMRTTDLYRKALDYYLEAIKANEE
jgi:hypothetical protein